MWRELTDAERERLHAAQRAAQQMIAAATVDEVDRAREDEFRSLEVDPRDGRALAAQDRRRLLVYRKLVRATITDAVAAQLPRTVGWMGPEAYEHAISAYCDRELPRSRVLRDVAYELAAWAAPRWRVHGSLPPALADLARYELFGFDVLTAERQPAAAPPPISADVAADETVAFDGTVRFGRFGYRVHELGELRPGQPGPQEPSPVALLAYRDHDGRYRELELTPLAADILERLLLEGEGLAAAVAAACRAADLTPLTTVIDGISKLLADLSDREVALGGRSVGRLPDPSPFFRWLAGAGPEASMGMR